MELRAELSLLLVSPHVHVLAVMLLFYKNYLFSEAKSAIQGSVELKLQRNVKQQVIASK